MINLALRYAVGIDIGGTYIKSGVVASNGKMMAEKRLPTQAEDGKERIIANVLDLLEIHKQAAANLGIPLSGIGIGTAGYVDGDGRIAGATDNIPGWAGTQLRRLVSHNSRLPVVVNNDINMIALGEWWIGAGQSLDSFLCIAIGTGVGGCMMTGGCPYRGRDGYAGGYGHHTIAVDGAECTCGKRGCWEQYASVTALMRLARMEYGGFHGPDSALSLFAAAREGDKTALKVVESYTQNIAVGLANLIHIFNPEAVIVGGGITEQGEFLFDRIKKHVAKRVLEVYMTPPVKIEPAKLGAVSGVMGAAKSVFDSVS